jgi:hypothetical protein
MHCKTQVHGQFFHENSWFFNVFEMPEMDSSSMLKNWNRWFSESEII